MLLAHLLDHLVTVGTLRVITVDGQLHTFSGEPGPQVTIRLHDRAVSRKLFFNPRLYAGEAYMDGSLTVEDGTIYDFLDLVSWNIERAPPHPLRRPMPVRQIPARAAAVQSNAARACQRRPSL